MDTNMSPRERMWFMAKWIGVMLVAFLYVVAVTKPIILTASDLGRHLTNGRIFLDLGLIPIANEYSYTYPDFPFLNHHWGSGVLFELARRFRGFVGVSVFGLCVTFLTVSIYLRIAWQHGRYWIAMAAAFLVLPIFTARVEIRPELFSYLLSGVFLWILLGVRKGSIPRWGLAVLPALLFLWVNLHIYFFLGIGWIGAFMVDALVRAWREPWNRDGHLRSASWLAATAAACCFAAVFNPNGWKGAVYPLLIFQNYAYQVAENQPLLAVERNGPYPPGLYLKIALCVLFVTWIWRLWRDWQRKEVPDVALLILTLFVSFIAWNAIRNFTIFAYVTMVSVAFAWSDVDLRAKLGKWTRALATAAPIATLALMVAINPGYWRAIFGTLGLGVAPNILASIDFFRGNDLHGPIFNNYDIGGFLTFGLYPQERVFVDNRPEAYPGSFFTQDLLPMQLNEEDWLRVDAKYGFNAIFFFRHDATRWGQMFMIRRLQDPAWAPVYVDGFVLILVRRLPRNADVIERFEIPKSRFEVQPRDRG